MKMASPKTLPKDAQVKQQHKRFYKSDVRYLFILINCKSGITLNTQSCGLFDPVYYL